ncbi:MAG: M24 family metallopeptidase [Phototrophicaceae bacterium]|jgi:Xaa-Pro aminopeptidase
MKTDLDHLMSDRDLAAVIVVSEEHYNATRDYLTHGARVSGGFVVKPHGQPPVMVVNPMETEEAKASGLQVISYSDLGYHDLVKQYGDQPGKLRAMWWQTILRGVGITSGKVGVYGAGDLNIFIELFRQLERELQGIQLVGEQGRTLFDEAMTTKDAAEISRMRDVARKTNEVMALTWDYIAGHRALGEGVVNADGQALTIGMVRRFVRRELLERDLEDTGMIFAQGRDGGFPHSRGQDRDALQQGQAIVFDLFPREFGGGYHHDMTRTWCIGYAPAQIQEAYGQVIEAFDRALELTKVGATGDLPQITVMDYFESLGHPTQRSKPGTSDGYTHSLGHGVGLNIHERPRLHHLFKDVLQAGSVVTIEPGLYYADQGYGIRIEDTVLLEPSGALTNLTPFHKQLVLPLGG